MRFIRQTAVVLICAAAAVGCGKRIPKPAGIPPGTPHVSWIVMHGDWDNPDREFACQSTGPRECALPASKPGQQVFSDIHFYFHGAGGETTYKGAYLLEFLGEGNRTRRTVPVEATVRSEEENTKLSVVGIVTGTAGRYALRITLDATVAGGAAVPLQEEVPIDVR